MRNEFLRIALILASAMFFLIGTAQSAGAKEVYTGTMIGVGGQMGGASRPFTLTINGYSSADDVSHAVAVLAEGGQDRLLDTLNDKQLGRFSLGGQLGRDLNFVYETRTADGGRRITILFARWMNLFELRSGARSEDYPFSYIELYIGADGKGQGTFIPAARVSFDKKHGNEVNVENFGIYPARLAEVRLEK
jgi:hypothetical protein